MENRSSYLRQVCTCCKDLLKIWDHNPKVIQTISHIPFTNDKRTSENILNKKQQTTENRTQIFRFKYKTKIKKCKIGRPGYIGTQSRLLRMKTFTLLSFFKENVVLFVWSFVTTTFWEIRIYTCVYVICCTVTFLSISNMASFFFQRQSAIDQLSFRTTSFQNLSIVFICEFVIV